MNTTDFLSMATAICPDRDSVVFGGERWTDGRTGERATASAVHGSRGSLK